MSSIVNKLLIVLVRKLKKMFLKEVSQYSDMAKKNINRLANR